MQGFGGLGDTLSDLLRRIGKGGAEAIVSLLKAIADLTYWNPHPPVDSPSELLMIPKDWGIWYQLWEYHRDIAVPVSVALLIIVWFARQAGVATNILGAQQRIQSNRSLISGIFAVFLSFHGVVVYLNLSQLIVTAIAPGKDPLANVTVQIIGTGGAVALALMFLNVSINGTLIILLFLINAARIFATFMLPVLIGYAVALHFARVPLLTGQVKKIVKLLGSAPLWTIPVAAGWRLMVILGGAAPGDETIGDYIISAAGVNGIAGSDVASQLLTSSLFMVPVLIGILAPLKMSGAASSAYYMSRMAGLSVGEEPDGDGAGGEGDGAPDMEGGEDGGGGGGPPAGGDGGATGDDMGGSPSSGGSVGAVASGGDSGGEPASDVTSAATETDDDLLDDVADAFDPTPNKQYLDREKADVTKRAMGAAAGGAKEAAQDTVESVKGGAESARNSLDDFLSDDPEINSPEGFGPEDATEAPDGAPENEPEVNASEEYEVGESPTVPDMDSGEPGSSGAEPEDPLFGGGEESVDPLFGGNGSSTTGGQQTASRERSSGSNGTPSDTGGATASLRDLFTQDNSGGESGRVVESPEGNDSGVESTPVGRPASSDDIDYGENEEFDGSAGDWQQYSPEGTDDTRSGEELDWLDEDNSLATQLEREE